MIDWSCNSILLFSVFNFVNVVAVEFEFEFVFVFVFVLVLALVVVSISVEEGKSFVIFASWWSDVRKIGIYFKEG